jgi:hypothetical protein
MTLIKLLRKLKLNIINQDILFDIIKKDFGGPRLISYFKQIIFAGIYKKELYYQKPGSCTSTVLSGFFLPFI